MSARKCCPGCALQVPLTRFGNCWDCHALKFERIAAELSTLRKQKEELGEALLRLDKDLEAAWANRTLPASVCSGETVRKYKAALKNAGIEP